MPLRKVLTDSLVHRAAYWAPAGPTASGQQGYAAPVEIPCRWDDVQVQFIDKMGNARLSRAVVLVQEELNREGVLKRGLLGDVLDTADPFANQDAFEIRQLCDFDTLDGQSTYRSAYL